MIIQADTEEEQQMAMAQEIGEILHNAYPGHLWFVTIRGGRLVVKDLLVSSLWGMVVALKDIDHDANVRKRKVIMAGGELLERAHLFRGMYDGTPVEQLEGAVKFKPVPGRKANG